MVEHLRFRGSIREVTVNRPAGRWFACFSIETGEPLPPVKDGPTIGVDVGITQLAVCSGGTVVENPRTLAPALKRLKRLDQAIARSRKVPMAGLNPANAGSGCTADGAGFMHGYATSGTTLITRPRRR